MSTGWWVGFVAYGAFMYGFGCLLTYLLYRPKIKLAEELAEAKDRGEVRDVKEQADQ